MTAVKMACMPLPYIFAALLDAPRLGLVVLHHVEAALWAAVYIGLEPIPVVRCMLEGH